MSRFVEVPKAVDPLGWEGNPMERLELCTLSDKALAKLMQNHVESRSGAALHNGAWDMMLEAAYRLKGDRDGQPAASSDSPSSSVGITLGELWDALLPSAKSSS